LSALLTESIAPKLLCIESKWSSLAAYGLTVQAFKGAAARVTYGGAAEEGV
jgi:hypothetical protein